MLLIGQYDSPFVRRVAITLKTYGLAYDHADWSGFGDVDRIAAYTPLRRVPALVMDDGVTLVDSAAIIDSLDWMVGPDRAVLARPWPLRREVLRVAALAAGVADKGVSLLYERAFRDVALDMWVARCRAQAGDTLTLLDGIRAAAATPWLFGDSLSHADVLLATMVKFITEALPGAFELTAYPALAAHSAVAEALPVFQATYKPYALAMPD